MSDALIKDLTERENQKKIILEIGESCFCLLVYIAKNQPSRSKFLEEEPLVIMEDFGYSKEKFYRLKRKCEKAGYLISEGTHPGPNSPRLRIKVTL